MMLAERQMCLHSTLSRQPSVDGDCVLRPTTPCGLEITTVLSTRSGLMDPAAAGPLLRHGFVLSAAYFPATSTGLSATETGDRRSINEIKNAMPMTIPPITNGVLP